jgi:hypothetical protein
MENSVEKREVVLAVINEGKYVSRSSLSSSPRWEKSCKILGKCDFCDNPLTLDRVPGSGDSYSGICLTCGKITYRNIDWREKRLRRK